MTTELRITFQKCDECKGYLAPGGPGRNSLCNTCRGEKMIIDVTPYGCDMRRVIFENREHLIRLINNIADVGEKMEKQGSFG